MKKIIITIVTVICVSTFFTNCREKTTGEKVEDAVEEVADDVEDEVEDVVD